MAVFAGASGVALSAMAAHTGGSNVETVARFLLLHAPALIALSGFAVRNPVLHWAGWILTAGLVLFCGDLLAREFLGARLFPMAAPAGGTLLIAGWIGVALAASRPSARDTPAS